MWAHFYGVCSFSLSPPLLSLHFPTLHAYESLVQEKVTTCANKVPASLGVSARVLPCTYIFRRDTCGRADRPSELLWQMKVMLRRRDARRKAGNKQPDLWRTLKHTSERKEGGKGGGGGWGVGWKVEKGQNEVEGKLFSSPDRAESITDQTAGHLSNAE